MKLNRFANYAWFVVAYNLFVILWGAYVRASGSGAGCGSHWPLCNGEVLPRSPQAATLIELTHRITSGLSLLLVIGLVVWAFRAYGKKHPARRGAMLSLFFIITEALIGAGLVLFELVADNASIARAMFMSVHLINTFTLMAFLALTAWWASGGQPVRLRGQGFINWLLGLALAGMLLLAVSGAVAVSGDTLFPSNSLAQGLSDDFSPTAHLLIRLRLLHPALALTVGCITLLVAGLVNFLASGRVGQILDANGDGAGGRATRSGIAERSPAGSNLATACTSAVGGFSLARDGTFDSFGFSPHGARSERRRIELEAGTDNIR